MFSKEEFEAMEEDRRKRLSTSHGRFWARINQWRWYGYNDLAKANGQTPFGGWNAPHTPRARELKLLKFKIGLAYLQHAFWWFVHNSICHPLIGVVPCKATFDFHDYTSKRLMPPGRTEMF